MAVYLIWRLLKKWPKFVLLDAILLLLTLYLLRGSRSATSVIVFIIGVMLLVAAALLKGDVRKLKKMVVITVLSLLILQGLFISVFNKSLESLLFSATDRNSSLTGRVPLWLKLIQIGSQRAILGSGYGSVWIADSSRMEDIFYGPQANPHNGYIHVFLDLGLVGLALLFILIFHAYKKVINSFEETGEIAILLLVFIIMILLHNITESTLMRGTNLLWFLFLLSSIIVIKKTDSPATHS
jgi:O-antigen ligase